MASRFSYYRLVVSALDDKAEGYFAVEDAVWNYLLELEGQDSEMYAALVLRAPADWPQHNEAMLLLSAKFPAVSLRLSEEDGNDYWQTYYQNGKVQDHPLSCPRFANAKEEEG